MLAGKIYINQDDFAITTIEYAIPPAYKKYICSFERENIQHFGYKVRFDYQKSGDKYFVKHIKQEDEFITIDTLINETTPYAAVSELFVESYQTDNKTIFPKAETLPNVDMSQLFEYPQAINQDFWKQYQDKFDYVKIPATIRKDMEAEETLENQFVNKLIRNENLLPPVAMKKESDFTLHGEKITDNYHWLKDTSKRVFHNEEVMSYLDKENAYVENYFRPLKSLQRTLFNEMVAQTEENFESLPYGAYGNGMNIAFDPTVPVLLNRGFIYVIAHVRGGNDLGMNWHQDGKMLNKMNTFTDFIDCAEFLIEEGYVQKGNIIAQGASAGGLLMGAVANMRPDLFKAIVLDVPFVDVINTMLDDKLPLTTGEYKEWGNPKEKKYYDYIKKYSPYENIKKQNYPHLIFTTSLSDTRVGYWEPAKMVAKLRENKTDDNFIFLKTQYHGGHGGGSGRYTRFRDLAYKWAIIFDLFERKKEIKLLD